MTREQIVEKLREALRKDARKAPEIAVLMRWHPGSVRNFKSGGNTIGIEQMVLLAKVLGYRLEWNLSHEK